MANSQERNDIGVIAGTSYYVGDFNPGKQFLQPSPALGVMFRHNFTDLFSFRASVSYGWLKGNYEQTNLYLPGETSAFSTKVVDLQGALEIGFIPFNTLRHKHKPFTPYVCLGMGAAYINETIMFQIPFGIGLKYSPANRWTLGLEWRLHKTFYDAIDGYINLSDGKKSAIHNNDWFGIAGFFVSFRLYKQGATCPAYMQ